jgi:hypothetical protein
MPSDDLLRQILEELRGIRREIHPPSTTINTSFTGAKWHCPKCGKEAVMCTALEPAFCAYWRESNRA